MGGPLVTSSFFDRITELQELVGDGQVTGSVVVDQIYAQYQHEGLDLRHPRGGQAKYLEAPLVEHADQYWQKIADRVLEEGPVEPMKAVVEDLAGEVEVRAPVDFNNLRRSANPRVLRGEAVVYDRPAAQRRLTQQELDDLRRGRRERGR